MSLKNKGLVMMLLLMLVVFLEIPMPAFGASPENDQPLLVTATFFDSDLKEALKEIALQTGVNIILDENVKGIITLDLKNAPIEKALRMMLIGGGYSYRKVDDFYFVGLPDPRNPAFADLCDSAVYYFKNISAESAKALVPNVYEPYVKFDPEKDSVNVIAPPELLKRIIDDFKNIDGEKKQIKIKALVTEVHQDVLKEWGIDLLKTGDPPQGYLKSTALDITNGAITFNGLGEFGAIYGNIKALVNDKKATIQADPEIVVTEGKTGELFVGDQRTLILTSPGSNVTASTHDVEAGTTLKVTPRVYDGQIELAVGQKVSSFDDQNRTDEILIRTMEFNSVVRFKPGQTVLIAGLTAKNTSNRVSKTPLLGDIPLIRLFFRQKTDQKNDRELLIFITAEVLK